MDHSLNVIPTKKLLEVNIEKNCSDLVLNNDFLSRTQSAWIIKEKIDYNGLQQKTLSSEDT